MTPHCIRVGAGVLIALAVAGHSHAQTPDVTAAVTATPNRVAPGGLVTVTVTLTNSGPATGRMFVGIDDSSPGIVTQTLGPPGVLVEHFPDCWYWDCSDPFTGFELPGLGRGSSVSLSLVLQVDHAPGATVTFTGFGAGAPSDSSRRSASTTVTVTGSGVPPSVPSMLLSDGITATSLTTFGATDVEFDPIHRTHVVAGATNHLPGLSVSSVTLDLQGQPVGDAIELTGPDEILQGAPSLAYSPDLGQRTGVTGAMVTWPAAGYVYARAVLSDGSLAAPAIVGSSAFAPVDIAYSHTERRFFDVWGSPVGQFLGLDTQPVGPVVNLDQQPFTRSTVTWNAVTNEFAVLYYQGHPERRSFFSFNDWTLNLVRVALDGRVLTRTQVAFVSYSAPPLLAVNSQSGEYVVVWQDGPVMGAEIGSNGRVISRGIVANQATLSEESKVSFNPFSRTFLAFASECVSFAAWGCTASGPVVWELNQYGAPLGAPIPVDPMSAAGISSRADAAEWRIVGTAGRGYPWDPPVLASEAIRSFTVAGGSQTRLGGCTSPDPFLAFGGSVCYDGGWLPPGVLAPGTSITYVSACSTPDPFVSIGGGRCINGGWFPPAAPSPPPTPTPTPTPTPGGCTTPDPFVAFGGGTCVGGGWFPPGMGVPAPTPPPPTPTPGGCLTPDPFVALGGGRCINGGWYPPGMGGQ